LIIIGNSIAFKFNFNRRKSIAKSLGQFDLKRYDYQHFGTCIISFLN